MQISRSPSRSVRRSLSSGSPIVEEWNLEATVLLSCSVPHRVLIETRLPEISDALGASDCAGPRGSHVFPQLTVNTGAGLWNLHSRQQQGGCALQRNPSGSLPATASTAIPGVGVQVCMNMDGRFQASVVSKKNQQVRTPSIPRKVQHAQPQVF